MISLVTRQIDLFYLAYFIVGIIGASWAESCDDRLCSCVFVDVLSVFLRNLSDYVLLQMLELHNVLHGKRVGKHC